MIISVASGKGGTGKTTVALGLALSLDNAELLDCDVEEPNVHLFLRPQINTTDSVNVFVPEVNQSKCTLCGKCKAVCVYKAIAIIGKTVLTFHELCHGCGACAYVCPERAIKEIPKEIGVVESGKGEGVVFVQGVLNIGAAMAPPVIREVKKHIAEDRITIIDAPPGTSCPVISAMKKTDFCVLVTEPTPFGLHDLKLAIEVVRKLKLPHGVVINRATLGDNETEKYCQSENIEVLLRIPFDRRVAQMYSQGNIIIRAIPHLKDDFREMYKRIKGIVKLHNSRT